MLIRPHVFLFTGRVCDGSILFSRCDAVCGILSFSGHARNLQLDGREQREYTVLRVLSVDTLLIEGDRKVRLLGISGPRPLSARHAERDEHGFIIPDDNPAVPVEEEALRFVVDQVQGRKVRLEYDLSRRSEDGLLQAYVFLPEGTMLNAEILRQGYARLHITPGNVKYAENLREAYREARREMRGLQGDW